LTQAQDLADFTQTAIAHTPRTISNGVTKYLAALRERAVERVSANPALEKVRYTFVLFDLELN
jgi:hypothetical protein